MGRWPELSPVKSQEEVRPDGIFAFIKPIFVENAVSDSFLFMTVSDVHSLFFVVVKFQQRSVFPVHLSTSTVKQWWGTDLIFKIYSRQSDQKKVSSFGINTVHWMVKIHNIRSFISTVFLNRHAPWVLLLGLLKFNCNANWSGNEKLQSLFL